MFGLLKTTTLEIFHDAGKKQRKRHAFKIISKKGFIYGRLRSNRPAEMPSVPGAELGFRDAMAVSYSQTDMAGIGCTERELSVTELASSSMIKCESSDDVSVEKKWLAHASALVAGSDVSTPLTVSAGGREID